MQPDTGTAGELFRQAAESYRNADYPSALEACEHLLRLPHGDGSLAAIHNLKALALAGLGNRIDAVPAIRQALQHQPSEARLHLHAARLYDCLGRHPEALQHLDEAARLAPDDPEPDYLAARIFRSIDQADAALHSARRSVRKHEGNLEGWLLLAELHEEQGDYTGALACLKPVLDSRPLVARAWAWLAEVEFKLQSGLPVEDSLRLARDEANSPEDYATAVFALAHLKRGAGLHARAFALYKQANHRLEQSATFAIDGWEARVSGIINVSGRQNIYPDAPGQEPSQAHPRLVFICGMPRSGTSLCEQVISSHPGVHGAGELPTMEYIEQCLRQRGIDPYGEDDSGWQEEMRQVYLGSLPVMKVGESQVVDKTPRNFERLGLILRLFPDARVLWMLRHPLDNILSCYFQDFASSQPYSVSLEHTARVYRGHLSLLRHWRTMLDARIKVVEYRQMVQDLEATTRDMAGFLGLDFQPAMLQPHLNPRVVRTASQLQVQQPVSTRSLDQWKKYRDEIGELMAQLQDWGLVDAAGDMTIPG